MSSLSLMGSASAQAYVNERSNVANATSRNVAEPYRHLLSKTCREGSRAGLFRPFRERPHYDPSCVSARLRKIRRQPLATLCDFSGECRKWQRWVTLRKSHGEHKSAALPLRAEKSPLGTE